MSVVAVLIAIGLLGGVVRMRISSRNAAELPLLTNIGAIKRLNPSEGAHRYPVRLTAIVTYHDPALKILIINDASGGMNVALLEHKVGYEIGDVLAIEGITGPGQFTAEIQNAVARKLGVASAPDAERVNAQEMEDAGRQNRFAEVRGTIESWADRDDGRLNLRVDSGGVVINAIVATE